MKLSSLKPGDVVYSVGRRRMGNTRMTRQAVWPVFIVSVNADDQSVIASWNGNKARRYSAAQVKRWRKTPPASRTRPLEAPHA